MTSIETLAKTLRTHGYSTTVARRAVFLSLQGQEPLTMRELTTRVPTIDRASVYRTISLFEQLGIVHRLQTGWKYKLELSGDFHEHHHHATCLECGKTFILAEDAQLEQYLNALAHTITFTLTHHQLELHGYCVECREKVNN